MNFLARFASRWVPNHLLLPPWKPLHICCTGRHSWIFKFEWNQVLYLQAHLDNRFVVWSLDKLWTLKCFMWFTARGLFVVSGRCWSDSCIKDTQKKKGTNCMMSGISMWARKKGGYSWSTCYGPTLKTWVTLRRVQKLLRNLSGSQNKTWLSRKCLALASHLREWAADLLAGKIACQDFRDVSNI